MVGTALAARSRRACAAAAATPAARLETPALVDQLAAEPPSLILGIRPAKIKRKRI